MAISKTPPVIALHNVSKRYGEVQAVQEISLSIAPGETVALLGPNGAGKSTTLALMLGLRRPSRGQIQLFGENPSVARRSRRIGVMLQESGLPSLFTVNELLELFGRFHEHSMQTQAALEMVGLEKQAKTRLGNLSGGQKQRVYFALALIGNPDLLFLDEPTTGLDVTARQSFWEQMHLVMARGKTIILTTHNLEEADALATRVVVINQGQIIADDTPEHIKQSVGGKLVSFFSTQVSDEEMQTWPDILHLRVTGSHFEIYTMHAESFLARLFGCGYDITDLQVVGAGLEEAFLALTAGKERQAL